MKDIKNIVAAFEEATRQGKKTALATVVHVNGSSYRRPGARMLVTEDGRLTGAISGGCLEGDALRKAVLAITQEKNKLVVYDTSDEDDAKLGVQLGCNGIVSVLFEPINERDPLHPLNLLKGVIANRKPNLLITAYSLHNAHQLGTLSLENYPAAIVQELYTISAEVFRTCESRHIVFPVENNTCQFFFEYLPAAVSLIIAGAGNDAFPLVSMADILGWPVSIIDGRITHASSQRFPQVENIFVGKPAEITNLIETDNRTAVVLMTHNYNYDMEMLQMLSNKPLLYIGMLGPASRRDRIFSELKQKGIYLSEEVVEKVHGPAGLDIGAETSEEIALSITSEIMAVLQQKKPIHLKQRLAAIHQPNI